MSPSALSVLGPSLYARYLATFVANAPRVMRAGDLRPLDKAMGAARRFRYRDRSFVFDCRFCDDHLDENAFAFGIVREIYIRDCYLRWQPPSVYAGAKTVVDLGANRGAFSTLMTTQAAFIVSVECGEQYGPIIRHNMSENDFSGYAIERAFIGGESGFIDSDAPKISMEELFRRHGIDSVDLMKMDIEGSEFELFASPDWLRRVRALSMEVHRQSGNPAEILRVLGRQGFTTIATDDDLQRVDDPKRAGFIYAWRDNR